MAWLERTYLSFFLFFFFCIILRQTHFFSRTFRHLTFSSFVRSLLDRFSFFSSLDGFTQARTLALSDIYTRIRTHIHVFTHLIRHAIMFVVNCLRSGVNLCEFPAQFRIRSSRNRAIPIPLLYPAIKIGDRLKKLAWMWEGIKKNRVTVLRKM